MTIKVLQFLRPGGRQVPQTTHINGDHENAYASMLTLNMRMTAEVLATGQVSVTIEDPLRGDYDIRIVTNGPAVQRAYESMLSSFDVDKAKAWQDAQDNE